MAKFEYSNPFSFRVATIVMLINGSVFYVFKLGRHLLPCLSFSIVIFLQVQRFFFSCLSDSVYYDAAEIYDAAKTMLGFYSSVYFSVARLRRGCKFCVHLRPLKCF